MQMRVINSAKKRKIVRGGRRSGKTTLAATLGVSRFMQGHRVLYATPTSDQADAFWREVCYALQAALDAGLLRKNETERLIEFPGTQQRIRAKTAWNADSLRGDYADVLILDEWQLMDEGAWEYVGAPMLLDTNGEALFIYTPPSLQSRSVSKARDPRHAAKLFKRARLQPWRWLAVHCASDANPHLNPEALSEIVQDMTQLAYRQEILAEDIEEVPGAMWTQAGIDKSRVAPELRPSLSKIVIGVDPTGSISNECGIVAVGIDHRDHRYVLRDVSLLTASPHVWASRAVQLYHELQADMIVGERNYGGDMIRALILQADPNVPYRDVTATRGKSIRAQESAAAWGRGEAHMCGAFAELETELCTYVEGGPSPNRLDAMVWAMEELRPAGHVLGWIEHLKRLAAGPSKLVAPLTTVETPAPPEQPKAVPACEHNQPVNRGFGLRCAVCDVAYRWVGGPAPSSARTNGCPTDPAVTAEIDAITAERHRLKMQAFRLDAQLLGLDPDGKPHSRPLEVKELCPRCHTDNLCGNRCQQCGAQFGSQPEVAVVGFGADGKPTVRRVGGK